MNTFTQTQEIVYTWIGFAKLVNCQVPPMKNRGDLPKDRNLLFRFIGKISDR
jgi:hypothetical protein